MSNFLKLLKYEVRYYAKLLPGILLALMLFSIIGGLQYRFGDADTKVTVEVKDGVTTTTETTHTSTVTFAWDFGTPSPFSFNTENTMAVSLQIIYGILIIAAFVLMIVGIAQRFYRNLLKNEGYLMLSLPVSPAVHITIKFVGALLMVVVLTLGVYLSGVIYLACANQLQTLTGYLAQMEIALLSGYGTRDRMSLIGIMIVMEGISKQLLLYVVILVGTLLPRFKVPASIALFFAISWLESLLLKLIAPGIYWEMATASLAIHAYVPIAFIALHFVLAVWLLRKKFNLE
jgi:hypothetical protein